MRTLSDHLKEAGRERHARMEALPFVGALTGGTLPLPNYVAQLRAMAMIHATLDQELRQAEPTPLIALHQRRPSRLAHLRADLGVFDPLGIPDCLDAVQQARHIEGLIRRTRTEQPDLLPAYLYVLEGMTLGNTVHLPDVIRTFGQQVAEATHYYAGYGEKTGEYWQEFRQVLNALPVAEGVCAKLVESVLGLFDLLEPLFAALFPVREGGWGFTATMLNSEAGNHQVPDNAAELRAASEAARRCCEEFPYFDARYGERGGRFARSDAAWLAALTTLPRGLLMGQVEWLGRFLGNRGMPRIALERQLELLHEELSAAQPERRTAYVVLLEASASLKAERLATIPSLAFDELSRQFDSATRGCEQAALRRTGDLIVSAVCDEVCGITNASESLVSWLADPQRFPAPWADAVLKTTGQARLQATPHGSGITNHESPTYEPA